MEFEDAFEKERGRNGERELSSQELALELERKWKASVAGGRLKVDNPFVLDALNNLKYRTGFISNFHFLIMGISENIHYKHGMRKLLK